VEARYKASSSRLIGMRTYHSAMEIKERMRNILVHAYARVDRDLVLRTSKSLIIDAPMIAERILRKADEMVRDSDDFEGVSIPLEDVLNKLREILKGRVKAAFLFGGRTKGYVLRGDIDIAVRYSRFLRPPL